MAGTKHPRPRELAALHQFLLNADDNDEPAELQFKTRPQPTATAPSAAAAQLPAARRAPAQGCHGVFPPQEMTSPPYPAWTLLLDGLPPPATAAMGHRACRRKEPVKCHCSLNVKKRVSWSLRTRGQWLSPCWERGTNRAQQKELQLSLLHPRSCPVPQFPHPCSS